MDLLTGTEDAEEQNIALDRIKYMVKEQFEHGDHSTRIHSIEEQAWAMHFYEHGIQNLGKEIEQGYLH